MLKSLKKVAPVRLHILCVSIKFHSKITLFVACANKTKNCVVKHYLETLKFVFFTDTKQKDIFSEGMWSLYF